MPHTCANSCFKEAVIGVVECDVRFGIVRGVLETAKYTEPDLPDPPDVPDEVDLSRRRHSGQLRPKVLCAPGQDGVS